MDNIGTPNYIFDNIVFDLQKMGGISVYWFELIKRMNYQKVFYINCNPRSQNILYKKLTPSELIAYPKITFTKNRYINPYLCSNKELVLFHSSYYRILHGRNVLNIVTVHDFTYEKYIKGLKKIVHKYQKYNALRRADGIICVSENTKNDMLGYYPKLKNKEIKVIHNGYDSNNYYYDVTETQKQVIFVGARKGYKNFNKVIEVLKNTLGFKLIIVGSKLTNTEKLLLDTSIPDRYEERTHIDNSELRKLYQNSTCLLYLSEYEGFGIPIIEAMACGCPVVALNSSSIPEISGNSAKLFEQVDIDGISNHIDRLFKDKELRDDYIKKGLINASRFNWDKAYQETIDFYNKVIEKKLRRNKNGSH